jgi:hypothetical protein
MDRGPIVAYKRSWSENSKGRKDQTLKTTIQPLSLCSQIGERNSREGRLHDVNSIAYLRSKTVQPMGGSSNIYRYPRDNPKVQINVGSIHSVKGQTHTATLVLETFWYDHNLNMLKPWIVGQREGWKQSDRALQKLRLKLHYVAMTRPTHLLCLAMKISTFQNGNGELDQELIQKLEYRGWHIKLI